MSCGWATSGRNSPARLTERRPRSRAWRSRGCAADLGAELTDFLNEIVAEDFGRTRLTRAFGLWNVIGRAERERLEADLRVTAG